MNDIVGYKKRRDLAGLRFGKLRVLAVSVSRKELGGGVAGQWFCECDCGRGAIVRAKSLLRGTTKSCGCYSVKFRTTHGLTGSPEMGIWQNMIARCHRPNATSYQFYGARGIRVCERWMKFPNFLADMGRRPSKIHSVDRIDPTKDYSPENCRWATPHEQAQNQSRTVLTPQKVLEIRRLKGALTTVDLAKKFGVSKSTIWFVQSNRSWPNITEESMAKKLEKTAEQKAVKRERPSKAVKENATHAINPDKRELFLKNKTDYAKALDRLSKAQSAVRLMGKTIKADGFSMRQIKLAIQLDTPEGESDFKALIAADLLAAQYAGAAIGQQLSMFLEFKDRTPAGDIAYDEGQRDSMQGASAKPGYSPETEQYRRYMQGFNEETERRVKDGIKKKPDDDKPVGSKVIKKSDKDASVKAAADRAAARSASATAAARPSSGTPMTRAEYQKQQRDARAQNRAEAEALFDKGAPPVH